MTMPDKLILGSRGSQLALWQARHIAARLEAFGVPAEIKIIRTTGDRITDVPLAKVGTKGLFTKEIEEALLAGEIDLAVHSLKDLPTEQPEGLTIAAVPPREDPRDVLVSRGGAALEDLPRGARIGTGSPRRAAQIRAVRPDLEVAPVRGNVDTRIRRMLEGRFHGMILAAAGLSRLGVLAGMSGDAPNVAAAPSSARVSFLSQDQCVPAVGQGALAIETRASDAAARALVAAIHHAETAEAVASERAFLAALGGGCRVPVAALALVSGGRLSLRGVVASTDGARLVRVSGDGAIGLAIQLGERLARQAIEQGADAILSATEP